MYGRRYRGYGNYGYGGYYPINDQHNFFFNNRYADGQY